MTKSLPCVLLVASLLACIAGQGFAQLSSNPSPVSATAVPLSDAQLETGGYKVIAVAVDDPFTFLPFIAKRRNLLLSQLNELLLNKPFTGDRARTKALQAIDSSGLTPNGQNSIELVVQSITFEEVNLQALTLKLRYRILSIAPPYNPGGAVESRQAAKTSPQTAAGISQMKPYPSLLPQIAYNRASGFLAGGVFDVKPTGTLARFLTDASIYGQGSTTTRTIDFTLAGSHHSPRFLTDTTWHIDYTNNAAPVGANVIEGAALSAQLDTQTRPIWKGSTVFRSGFLVQGGNQKAEVASTSLSANTVANTGVGSIRMYDGFSQFSNHNALTVSYGFELGSIAPVSGIDWRKQIGEVSDDFWWNLGDHRPLELESNFNVGALQVPGHVPFADRFFGGNSEHFFIPNDKWQIHDQPYIRAIPANQFALSSDGLGGESFTSVNLTLSYPFFIRPLVTRDVTSDPAVKTAINGALGSAQSLEENYYQYKDPNYTAASALLPPVKTSLEKLQNDQNAVRAATNNPALDFEDCSEAISAAIVLVNNAQASKDMTQYGRVTSLTNLAPSDDDDLGLIQQYCSDLNSTLNNDLASVNDQRTALLVNLRKIDTVAAQKKAAADLSLARKTLSTLFTEINIVSVAPVAVFDIARLGPSASNGTRIGPGAGVRLELASYADFTAGYAINIYRHVGEDRGAVFFSMTFRNLFR